MPYDPYREVHTKAWAKYRKSFKRKKVLGLRIGKKQPTPQATKKFAAVDDYYENFDDGGDWIKDSPIDKKYRKLYGKNKK